VKLQGDLPLAWRINAGARAIVIPVLILLVPLDRLVAFLGRSRARADKQPSDQQIAAWTDQRLHRLPWPWRHTCLRRSAVIYHLLRRTGRQVELCVGVKRDAAGALAAHAWLSLNGAPYLEYGPEATQDFAIVARFPEASRAIPE